MGISIQQGSSPGEPCNDRMDCFPVGHAEKILPGIQAASVEYRAVVADGGVCQLPVRGYMNLLRTGRFDDAPDVFLRDPRSRENLDPPRGVFDHLPDGVRSVKNVGFLPGRQHSCNMEIDQDVQRLLPVRHDVNGAVENGFFPCRLFVPGVWKKARN